MSIEVVQLIQVILQVVALILLFRASIMTEERGILGSISLSSLALALIAIVTILSGLWILSLLIILVFISRLSENFQKEPAAPVKVNLQPIHNCLMDAKEFTVVLPRNLDNDAMNSYLHAILSHNVSINGGGIKVRLTLGENKTMYFIPTETPEDGDGADTKDTSFLNN